MPSLRASVVMREEKPDWSWVRNKENGNIYPHLNGRSQLRIELAIVDEGEDPVGYGVLLLMKDLRKGTFNSYSLRRVEHLQRSMIPAFRKFKEA